MEGSAPDPVAALAVALSEAADAVVTLERPSDAAHGDYATNVALRLAGERRQPPREVAEALAESARALPGIERAEVAGPGFLNVFLTDEWYAAALSQLLAAGDRFGAGSAATPERVQVELVSANPTGPGHGRVGPQRRVRRLGGEAPRLRRSHRRARVLLQRRGRADRSLPRLRRRGTARRGASRGRLPRRLHRRARRDQRRSRAAGCSRRSRPRWSDSGSSSTRSSCRREVETEVEQTLPLLDTYEADGALWARTSAHGDDKDRVLVRSNGKPTYFAVDAAYVRRKYARGFDRIVYVLGADHHGYVARLQALAEMLGHPRESLEVLLYQLVHLVRGGEATKMAKRRGDVVFLDEFVDEIGVDAARWYLVSRGHDQTIDIDVDLAAEKSQKNPVYYVQYAHARIAGILRNAEARPGNVGT